MLAPRPWLTNRWPLVRVALQRLVRRTRGEHMPQGFGIHVTIDPITPPYHERCDSLLCVGFEGRRACRKLSRLDLRERAVVAVAGSTPRVAARPPWLTLRTSQDRASDGERLKPRPGGISPASRQGSATITLTRSPRGTICRWIPFRRVPKMPASLLSCASDILNSAFGSVYRICGIPADTPYGVGASNRHQSTDQQCDCRQLPESHCLGLPTNGTPG